MLKAPQLRTLAAAIAAVSASTVSVAQQDPAPVIEEIIVTAQKRSQSAQDVPIALTALSNNELANSGITSFEAIQQGVSGVVINAYNGLVQPFIRGVGSFNSGAATYQSVAVYVDDVYLARGNASFFGLDNVEQVEVLKGPQSTLYGRNATGGAITVRTANPEIGGGINGKIKAGIGNYNETRVSGHVTGGIGDKWAASLTGATNKHDGYVKNKANPPSAVIAIAPDSPRLTREDDVESLDEQMLLAKIRFQPSEAMDFVLASSYHQADDTRAFAFKDTSDPTLDEWESYSHFGGRDVTNTLTSLTANIDFGSVYLISISAHTRNEFVAQVEAFGQPELTGGFFGDWNSEKTSQELRLHASPDATIQWLAGFQYSDEGDSSSQLWGAANAQAVDPGAPAGAVAILPGGNSDWSMESYAAFAEAVLPVTERLNITTGLRNTWEEFSVSYNNIPGQDNSENWSEMTYRLVADYAFDWGMGYASYTKGFVSGGYNVQNPGPVIDPEELYSAEVGIKADMMEGRLRFNAAAFNYSYEHIHAQTIDPATGTTNQVAGDKATVNGLEFEAQYAISGSTFAKLGVTHLIDREYDDFEIAANGSFPAISASGNTIAGAPATSLVFNLDNETELAGGSLQSVLNIQYLSGVYFDIDEVVGSGGPNDDAYTLVNFSTSWTPASEKWSIGAFVSNIFEEHYYIAGIASGPGPVKTPAAITGDPRTFGVTASYFF